MALRRIARRLRGVRADDALLLAGGLVMTVGSFMSWIRGSTRMQGSIDWTGLHDTGEGAMLVFAAVFVGLWVRLDRYLLEIDARARFGPLVIAVACGLLWVIAVRKIFSISWFDIAVGARPQPGLWIAGFGVLLTFAGGLLAATQAEAVAMAARQKRGSGAGGGVDAASTTSRRGGERPPSRDDYSVSERVRRVNSPGDDAADGGPHPG